jgi:hypothetical protein
MRATVVLGILLAVCRAQTAGATVIQQGAAYSIADMFVDHNQTAGTPGMGSHAHASNVLPPMEEQAIVAANVAGGWFEAEGTRHGRVR